MIYINQTCDTDLCNGNAGIENEDCRNEKGEIEKIPTSASSNDWRQFSIALICTAVFMSLYIFVNEIFIVYQ